MTIREEFERRQRLLNRSFAAVAVVAIVIWTIAYPHLSKLQTIEGSLALGGVLGLILIPIVNRLFRCPRCNTNFREHRLEKLGRFNFDPRQTHEIWAACPQCGVSFDEPYHR
jgi:hypothetical protein